MSNLRIKLGPHWVRFAASRPGFEFLGTVEQGPGIGALVRADDGTYWQLNGDHERKLNTSCIEAALRVAKGSFAAREKPAAASFAAPPAAPATQPTIVVKRRRTIVREVAEGL